MDNLSGSDRLARLRAAMDETDLDVAAIVPGANFYFLTGAHFHLMERPTLLFVTREGPQHAIVPVLERTRWESLAPAVDTIYWQDSDGYEAAFQALARRLAPGRIGVEGQRMRVFEAEAIRTAMPSARDRRRARGDLADAPAQGCRRDRRAPPGHRDQRGGAVRHAGARRRRDDRDRIPPEARGRDARRRRGRTLVRPDRAGRRRLRRPARNLQPRPQPRLRPAAPHRLRGRLGRIRRRHHPHGLRRVRQPAAPRHLRGGARRQRPRPQPRRAAA